MTPLETVNSFMTAAAKRDYDVALPLLTEDVEYQNMPIAAVKGRDAVKERLWDWLSVAKPIAGRVCGAVEMGFAVLNPSYFSGSPQLSARNR